MADFQAKLYKHETGDVSWRLYNYAGGSLSNLLSSRSFADDTRQDAAKVELRGHPFPLPRNA